MRRSVNRSVNRRRFPSYDSLRRKQGPLPSAFTTRGVHWEKHRDTILRWFLPLVIFAGRLVGARDVNISRKHQRLDNSFAEFRLRLSHWSFAFFFPRWILLRALTSFAHAQTVFERTCCYLIARRLCLFGFDLVYYALVCPEQVVEIFSWSWVCLRAPELFSCRFIHGPKLGNENNGVALKRNKLSCSLRFLKGIRSPANSFMGKMMCDPILNLL